MSLLVPVSPMMMNLNIYEKLILFQCHGYYYQKLSSIIIIPPQRSEPPLCYASSPCLAEVNEY